MSNIPNSPLFILGNNRSGTSLLRLILTCHDNVIIPPESHFLLWLNDKYKNWNPTDGFNFFLKDLYAATKFETWQIPEKELKSYLIVTKPQNYAELVASVYLFYGQLLNKDIKLWGDKNSLWVEKLNTIKKLYPHAKYIHIIRDGRDVATSYLQLNKKNNNSKYYPNLPGKIDQIAKVWSKNVSELIKFFTQMQDETFLEVKYENLILDHKNEIEKILNFLKLPLSEKVFSYYKINDEKNYEPKEFMNWKQKLNHPPDELNIKKYRQILSPEEITLFNSIAKKELQHYEYI